VEEPLYFVDFLRDPVVDEETGEVLNAHPSHYESVPGGLPEIRAKVEALQRRFNEETKVGVRGACCMDEWGTWAMTNICAVTSIFPSRTTSSRQ
jgi:hypothetical protein